MGKYPSELWEEIVGIVAPYRMCTTTKTFYNFFIELPFFHEISNEHIEIEMLMCISYKYLLYLMYLGHPCLGRLGKCC
jgi:hypothetical protein